MNERVKYPPFISHKSDTYALDVIVAALPLVVWAALIFGAQTLWLPVMGAICCAALDAVICFFVYKRPARDLFGSVATGIIMALALPSDAPVWVIALGSLAAIVVAKYPLIIFGKRGGIFSPAALGILVCALCVGGTSPFLDAFRSGAMPEDSIVNTVIGNVNGAIGTVSVVLLAASGIYLLLRRVVSVKIVFAALVVLAALSLSFFPEWTTYTDNLIHQIISGGFLFYLLFVACDRNGTPFGSYGTLIYGACFALLTFILRCYTDLPVPEAISVLVVNVLSPVLDTLLRGSPFGGRQKTKQ